MLLIHSVNAAASAYEIKPLYDHYQRQRPVYALELPGYGASDRADRHYVPRLMTDAVHEALGEIKRAHPGLSIDALAVSLSCEFLARAASENPLAFRSVAFVSPTGFDRKRLRRGPAGSNRGKPWLLKLLMRPVWRRKVFDWLTTRRSMRYFLSRTWGSAKIDEGLLNYCEQTVKPAGAEFAPLHFLAGFLFSADSGTLYEKLTMPVWASHGVRGDFQRYPALELFATQANWVQTVFQTGALPHFERQEAFVKAYDAFLTHAGEVHVR